MSQLPEPSWHALHRFLMRVEGENVGQNAEVRAKLKVFDRYGRLAMSQAVLVAVEGGYEVFVPKALRV